MKSTAWYFKAIQWASENGIAQGFDGTFGPNASITREQMAAMLYNYAKYAGLDVSGSEGLNVSDIEGMAIREFSDYESISGWAVTPIQWAMKNGILSGDGGRFAPKSDATRAQAAKIVALLIQGTIEE